MAKNQLAILEEMDIQIVPSEAELAAITAELRDMGTTPFGRAQIAAAGAGVFRVTEPGEDEPVVATEITAVVIMNHRTNVLWLAKYGTVEDKTPDCLSLDGEEGTDRETGEIKACATCRYNQYGSADDGHGRGKACKNTRRLYLMRPAEGGRPGDVLPMILTLPSTALTTFDKYRTIVMLARKQLHGVVTKITLKNAMNKDGIAYSTPVFKLVGALPALEAERVKQYADGFGRAMKQVDVYDEQSGAAARPAASQPEEAKEDLPF